MLARLNILMALASLLPPPTGCDLLLSTVFLINSVKFNPAQYERILSQSFGPATLLSVQSETPTGAEVRNLYFPDHTEVRLFQLVHITRVQAAIVTANETNTTYHLSRRLSEFCRDAIAPVVIVSSGGGGGSTAFDFLSQIPPLVAPVAIGVWLSTVVACGICWVCICCCRRGSVKSKQTPEIETAVELPTPEDALPETTQPEPPPPAKPSSRTVAPPIQQTTKPPPPISQPSPPSAKPQQPISQPPPPVKPQKPISQLPPPAKPTEKIPASASTATSGPAETIDLTPGIILNHRHCLPLMRLPPGLESADQYDLYEAPTHPGGPAAVRLESWPEASDS